MELKTKGKAIGLTEPLIVKVSRDPEKGDSQSALLVEDYLPNNVGDFRTVLSTLNFGPIPMEKPFVHQIKGLSHLADGDIVAVNTDGVINTLYRVNSQHNFLLATERCNSNCLMCSQPPRDREDVFYLHHLHQQLIPMIPKDCAHLGITGGEPTLMGSLFFDLLKQLQQELPDTEIHCLTNGRSFAWHNMAAKLGELGCDRLTLGIPLYSDYYQQHDYIVQAKDAFNQTVQGLYNLAKYGQRIEIRVVLQKQSIPRLTKLAQFIYRNLPFVEHVAFMGLEYKGYTPHNIDHLWIDPVYYMNELGEALEFLSLKQIPVSIYNTQLCLLPKDLWPYSRKSISDWKNIYLDECKGCDALAACGGLFASGEKKHSDFLRAF